jgi:hypothetical protein
MQVHFHMHWLLKNNPCYRISSHKCINSVQHWPQQSELMSSKLVLIGYAPHVIMQKPAKRFAHGRTLAALLIAVV